MCKALMAGMTSLLLVAGLSLSAHAAVDPKDQWGEIPDGFTFETVPSGVPTVYTTPNPDPENGAAQGSAGQSTSSDVFNYTLEEFADEIIYYVNVVRTENGLSELKTDSTLTEMAQARIVENNGVLTHRRPGDVGFWTIFDEYDTNLKATGENIAGAGGIPESIVRGFLTSEGHKANLLNPDAEYIGIGVKWVDTIIGPQIAVLQLFAK